MQSCFGGIAGMVWGVLHFYLGLLSTALGLAQQVFAAVTGMLQYRSLCFVVQ
jgi:hypothetical protein